MLYEVLEPSRDSSPRSMHHPRLHGQSRSSRTRSANAVLQEVRSNRLTRNVRCRLAKRRATPSGTRSPHFSASVFATSSHAPTSVSSRTLGNFAIHRCPSGLTTLAFGRALRRPPGRNEHVQPFVSCGVTVVLVTLDCEARGFKSSEFDEGWRGHVVPVVQKAGARDA